MSSTDWLAAERADLASRRILDRAEELFTARGVSSVTMRDVAQAVGCSRATLYRYFPGKTELLAAYVDRAAGELAEEIARGTRTVADPAERLVAAVRTALDGVRGNPALAAWFTPETAGPATHLALVSPAIESIATSFLGGVAPASDETDRAERARWLVRVIVSLLSDPAGSPDAEADLLRRFVVPVIITGTG
ncbi:TetR/AcrR family transcriptional regulator [Gordonia bronchialis]|uniref:TetR/AcrR family transcriptional regulator n=1 Tax=Gordonia bronchialis TaxID=2054 RepID=UPI00226F237F|nr:TetR/AcrR family transcriptional regulator [Gordonia bronchialis]